MRASFPVNPRRVRRASEPQHHDGTLATSVQDDLLLLEKQQEEHMHAAVARAEAMLANASQRKAGKGGSTPSTQRDGPSPPSPTPRRREGDALDDEDVSSSATAAARAEGAVSERAAHAAPSARGHASDPKACEADALDNSEKPPTSSSGAAPQGQECRMDRVRSLLSQVELPFLDTCLIETYVLHPLCTRPNPVATLPASALNAYPPRPAVRRGASRSASATSTTRAAADGMSAPQVISDCTGARGGGEAGSCLRTSSQQVLRPTPAASLWHVSPALQGVPQLRRNLADLHINSDAQTKRTWDVVKDTVGEPQQAPTSTSATAPQTSATESPLLSLKMLKGSKHAFYYLPGDDDCAQETMNPNKGDVGDNRPDKHERETRSETRAGATALRVEVPSASSPSIASTCEVGLKPKPNTPRLLVPFQRGGAPPLAPQLSHAHMDSLRCVTPRRAVSSAGALSSTSPCPTSASPSPSHHEEVLGTMEAVLAKYKAALAVALRAVQHREAVWTALQQFLHVVRKDLAPHAAVRAASTLNVRDDTTPFFEKRVVEGQGAVRSLRRDDGNSSPPPPSPSESAVCSSSSDDGDDGDDQHCGPPRHARHHFDYGLSTAQGATSGAVQDAQATVQTPVDLSMTNENGEASARHHPPLPLRTTLCLSLEHLLSQQPSSPTPSSSAGLTSPPPPPHTPRPPLLSPSSSGISKGAGNVKALPCAGTRGSTSGNNGNINEGASRPRAHSASTFTATARHTSAPQDGSTPFLHRTGVPTARTSATCVPLLFQHGSLPSSAATRVARLPQRRATTTEAERSDTPQSSARGTATLMRSRSAPRVPPVALLSPRPPSGRAAAVTPRARILSKAKDTALVKGVVDVSGRPAGLGCVRHPRTPSAPRSSASAATATASAARQRTQPFLRRTSAPSAIAKTSTPSSPRPKQPPLLSSSSPHDGVVSLEARVHAVPRRVYTNCLYHYLFYLQHTTLEVIEAVEVLRRDHLSHPAPFIVEHRNYLLEVVTQSATLARDATVQRLLHDDAGAEGGAHHASLHLHHLQQSSHTSSTDESDLLRRSPTPLRPSRGRNASSQASPLFSAVRRSSSNPTQETEQEEESAAHRALQVAAIQGRWPEQLLRHPLLSTHASLAPFAVTPGLLLRMSSTPRQANGAQISTNAPTRSSTEQARLNADVQHDVAELLRVPAAVLERYGGGENSVVASAEGEANGRAHAPSSLSMTPTAAANAVEEAGGRRRTAERPSSAAVLPLKPLSRTFRKRLERGEQVLHREVATALSYVQLCMQLALRREYPLYLRGLAPVCLDCERHHTEGQVQPGGLSSLRWSLCAASPRDRDRGSWRASSPAERASGAGAVTSSRGGKHGIDGTVRFASEELRIGWMEELKVSWQLLMSGSSSVE